MLWKSGWSIKPYGKYTFQLQSTFLAPNLICPPWMHFTKQAFSFYDDNQERGQGQNCWYYRIFQRSFTLTLKDSALVTSTFQKIYKWGPLKRPQLLQVHPMGKHNKRLTGTLRFTWTRKSLKDLSAPLLSCISPNSVCFGALNSFFVHLSFLMLHEITVIAQRDSTNVLKLQLEQPWLLHAPFVPCQPFFFPNSSATSGRTASSI